MSHTPHAATLRRRGMTMVELAITVSIVGLLAVIAAPIVRTALRRHALEDASQRLASDLVRAQSLAIKLNRGVTVERMGLTGYRVDGGVTKVLPNDVAFASTSADSVRFASFGPPTTGAATFTMQWEARTRAVAVNAAGRVIR